MDGDGDWDGPEPGNISTRSTILGWGGLVILLFGAALWGRMGRLVEGSLDKWLWSSKLTPYGSMLVTTLILFVVTAALTVTCILIFRYASPRMAGGQKTVALTTLGILAFMFGIQAWGYGANFGGLSCRDENGDRNGTTSTYYVDVRDGTANYVCLTPQEQSETLRQYAWRP